MHASKQGEILPKICILVLVQPYKITVVYIQTTGFNLKKPYGLLQECIFLCLTSFLRIFYYHMFLADLFSPPGYCAFEAACRDHHRLGTGRNNIHIGIAYIRLHVVAHDNGRRRLRLYGTLHAVSNVCRHSARFFSAGKWVCQLCYASLWNVSFQNICRLRIKFDQWPADAGVVSNVGFLLSVAGTIRYRRDYLIPDILGLYRVAYVS